MTARSRVLGGAHSPPPQSSPPQTETLNSDFAVIVAALICALICVLGLAVVARCAWIRRIAGGDSAGIRFSAANKGLKKKVLESLPKSTYGESSEQAAKLSDCAICLSEFSAGEEIRVLPQCGHGFHVACIDTWLKCHSSCPSCRQILMCRKCGSLPATAGSAAGAIDVHGDSSLP